MEYFQIRNFRPVEAKEDGTDQDRSVLRLCEGLVPVPQGALSAGPLWKVLWGQDDLITDAAALLAGADDNKAHMLQLQRGDRVFLIVWSLPLERALGFFEVVAAPTESNLDATDGVSLTAPSAAPWRDLDPTALWFASLIGNRWFLGNGVDNNLVWSAGALEVLGPGSVPTDVYDLARERIPPCTCFRMHVNRSIFATGNATHPLRVWITPKPNATYPTFDGVQSLDTSWIDIHASQGATRTVALSVYQQYVTVHTDRGPVNLYGVDNTADGWKCEQSPSAANASAINPACVGDAEGDGEFYFGRDLEVYQDQAVRVGPYEKKAGRAQEIVTEQGADVWNRDMQQNLATYGYHTLYDRNTRLFWIFARSIYAGRSMVWVFNARTRTCAGPIHYPDAIVSTALAALNISHTRRGGIGFMQIGSSFGVG
jgi:hypothetical protein